MKSRNSVIRCIAAAFVAACLLSCSKGGQESARAGAAPEGGPPPAGEAGSRPPEAGSRAPEVGDEIIVPAVGLERDDLVIAYRHSGHDQSEHGFDTEVFRFRANANGSLRALSISDRHMDGELLADSLDFLHVNDTVTLRPSSGEGGKPERVLKPEGGALVLRGEGFAFSYSAPAAGRLRIERRRGERAYAEEWSRSGSILADSAGPGAKGRFEGEWPKPSRYIERPEDDDSGASDTEFEFFDMKGGVKFRSDSVEPLGEALVLGLDRAFPEGPSLEAVALLDIALGEERRITPLLARLYLGGGP